MFVPAFTGLGASASPAAARSRPHRRAALEHRLPERGAAFTR